jgi:hypothetical protein
MPESPVTTTLRFKPPHFDDPGGDSGHGRGRADGVEGDQIQQIWMTGP